MMQKVAAVFLFVAAVIARAQVPVDQLSKPPADAQAWAILSTAGTHGKAALWVSSDGRRMCRESVLLRGRVWETDESVRFGPDGLPDEYVVRGSNPHGDAAETFSISDGVAKWKSPVDSGSAPYKTSFYIAQGGSISGSSALLIEALLKSKDRSLALLPGGRASAVKLTDLILGSGATAKTVTAWAVTGLAPGPIPIWATAEGKFFGVLFGLSVLPAGYESYLREAG
jgi:hypothetical protein